MASKIKDVIQETNLETGLETQEVQKRLAQYGYNEVPEKKVSFLGKAGKTFLGHRALDA